TRNVAICKITHGFTSPSGFQYKIRVIPLDGEKYLCILFSAHSAGRVTSYPACDFAIRPTLSFLINN
ncbi:hypothetical protein MJM43_31755, partial [Salmonella enterica subsp. enterica serovar Montevideo]|nr:hypothetical protein [Salmonella enterica subsp. enterica serovar Montevideo]